MAFYVQADILTAANCAGDNKYPAVFDRCSAMAASGLCGILQSGNCSNIEVYSETMTRCEGLMKRSAPLLFALQLTRSSLSPCHYMRA